MASCEACLRTLITVTVVWGDGRSQRVEVDALDEVRSLADRTSQKFGQYVHNGQVLLPAMSFSYYGIRDGSVIVAVPDSGSSRPKAKPRRPLWRVDESRPIQIISRTPLSSERHALIFQYMCNVLTPGRARAIAKIADNRLLMGERQLRRIAPVEPAEPIKQAVQEVEKLNTCPGEKPGESELPVFWNQPEQKNAVNRDVVIVALSPSSE